MAIDYIDTTIVEDKERLMLTRRVICVLVCDIFGELEGRNKEVL
jgi:hypothetical protein